MAACPVSYSLTESVINISKMRDCQQIQAAGNAPRIITRLIKILNNFPSPATIVAIYY
jgi:precorrin isomerase